MAAGDTSVLVHSCYGEGGPGHPDTCSCGKAADGSTVWPKEYGALGPHTVTVLKPGELFDRFGHPGGTFVCPNGTSYTARALEPGSNFKEYHVYEVTNRLVVQRAVVRPWFGEKGMGIQYRLPASVQDLLDAGYVREVS